MIELFKQPKYGGRVNVMQLNTSTCGSIESLTKDINGKFAAKVVLVNHEKEHNVDNACSNLGIKYNMLYISAYQLIKEHIENKSEWGHRLLACRKDKSINSNKMDMNLEAQYSPVHFDMAMVVDLIRETVASKKTNQKFVLLEGLCNSRKLQDENDQLALRYMDEFFCIEGTLGEIKAIVGLQHEEEQYIQRESDIKWEEFEQEEVKEDKPAADGDDQNPDEPVADPVDGDEPKKEVFKKEDFKWTKTDKESKNLPQLFTGIKGINTIHDKKEIECNSQWDRNTKEGQASYSNWLNSQISDCLNGFCGKLNDSDNQDKFLYTQVIFKQK